jgi:hypothetical protein
VFALGSEFAKSFAFLFGKCHDVFLHTQSSQVDYEENIPYSLRHYNVDVTLVFVPPLDEWVYVDPEYPADLIA